jgi:hypothetical protein
MIRRTIPVLAAATLMAATGYGQITVNYDAAPGERNIVDSSGTPLAGGNIAAIG